MGEAWRDHHNLKDNPRLKETGGLDHVEIRKEMPLVEKTALQTALAIHAFLSVHKQPMEEIDFAHPWANKQINRNEVMKEWLLAEKGTANAEKLREFLESMDPNDHETVNITEKEKREALLARMHINIQPSPDSTTMH